MAYKPVFDAANARRVDLLAKRITGLQVSKESWTPFIRSLENTIMKQTAADDIKNITVPMDVIYGSFDMLVIRGEPQLFFGKASADRIKAHTIRARHEISMRSSRFIVGRIEAAMEGKEVAAAQKKQRMARRGR